MAHKVVYVIKRDEKSTKTYWTKIGVAFTNRDGSLNVQLECLPLDGRLHIRDYVPRAGEQPTPEEPPQTELGFDNPGF
jgi:hypothetical protein